MRIRALALDEVSSFAALTREDAGDILRTAAFLRDRGETRDGWWFVGEEGGRAVARVAFWAQPSAPGALNSHRLHVPWEGDFAGLGGPFLKDCLRRARAGGAVSVEARAYPDSDGGPEKVEAVYAAAGIPLVQRKDQYARRSETATEEPSRGLRFRPLAKSSEGDYCDAIRRASEGTLDRGTRADFARQGPDRAAREMFDSLRDIHWEPAWWLLAETGGGALAGLVVPQRLEAGLGAINYIGVVPEFRGRRFGAALLGRAVNLLVHEGLHGVVADIDQENAPMAAALKATGFARDFAFSVFAADLAAIA